MVKLGSTLKDPATAAHIAYCRKLGFNAVFAYSHAAGRWTKESARFGPSVDREIHPLRPPVPRATEWTCGSR
jgi:hypothetical protein